MKIKYAFLDGTVTEVEVFEEIGAVIIDSRKAEHAQDERHRYHCYSYDAIDYEGEEYGAYDKYAVEDDSAEQTARIREAFSHLTATQQRRLRLYANGKTLREIAAIEEASFIYAFLKAQETGKPVTLCCAIGDNTVDGRPYAEIVEIARSYIRSVGGFEKFAEWGLV